MSKKRRNLATREHDKKALAIGEAISTPQARRRIQELAALRPGQTAIYDMKGMTANAARAIEMLTNDVKKAQKKQGVVRVTYTGREVRVKCTR